MTARHDDLGPRTLAISGNDIANLAFISGDTNRRISKTSSKNKICKESPSA